LRILIIDNFDSFTFNLYHYCEQFAAKVVVKRNDNITVEEALSYDKILISPGPGLPIDAGQTPNIIRALTGIKPMLGVCLGLQAIVENEGGSLRNLKKVMHGRATKCFVTDASDSLFKGIPTQFKAGHYHSWVADEIPASLKVTASNEEGIVMAVSHAEHDIKGVQFHPESLLTEYGLKMIENWVLD
jgi:anthranilate synthase component 2